MASKPQNLNLKTISSRVDQLSSDFNDGLQLLRTEFLNFKENAVAVPENSAVNTNFISKLNDFEKNMKSSLQKLSKEISDIRLDVTTLQNQVSQIEMQNNNNALIIHGFDEAPNKDMYDKLSTFIGTKMEIKIGKSNINYFYRLGKKSDNKTKPRPLVVQFACRWLRDDIFFNKKKLKGTRVMITELLTYKNLCLFKKAREQFGNNAWTFYGQVYVHTSGGRKLVKSEQVLNDSYQDVSSDNENNS